MGPHPSRTAGKPQGAYGLALVPCPTWPIPNARPRTNSAQWGSSLACQDSYTPTIARLRSQASRRHCDVWRAYHHSSGKMDPPTEACCHFRRCARDILAADAQRPTHALGFNGSRARYNGTVLARRSPTWRTTVHKRMLRCMRWKVAFHNMLLSTWGPWHEHASVGGSIFPLEWW